MKGGKIYLSREQLDGLIEHLCGKYETNPIFKKILDKMYLLQSGLIEEGYKKEREDVFRELGEK